MEITLKELTALTQRYTNKDVSASVLDDVSLSIELLQQSRQMLVDFTQELGLTVIRAVLDASAMSVAGAPHPGKKGSGVRHWGSQDGYVKLGGHKIRLPHPRLRGPDGEVEVPAYERLSRDPRSGARLTKAALKGVSSRNYKEVVTGSLDAVGVSKSSVSREFVKETAAKVEDLMNRPIQGRILAVIIDGVRFAGHLVVGAIGVNEMGTKQVLGVSEGSTENTAVVKTLLAGLKERGIVPRTLFVVDGAGALRAGIREVFGEQAPVQRCRFHKMKNVIDKLPKTKAGYVGAAMRAAYKLPHEEGIRRMKELAKEIEVTHPGAAASLREGLEETFTVNRIGLPPLLRSSLGTTNLIENAHGSLKTTLARFKNRSQGAHVVRWVCSAFLEAEKTMRTLKGHKDLWMLRAFLDEETQEMTG